MGARCSRRPPSADWLPALSSCTQPRCLLPPDRRISVTQYLSPEMNFSDRHKGTAATHLYDRPGVYDSARERTTMPPIRVLLVDDSAVMRSTLRTMLAPIQGLQIIEEVENGRAAVQIITEQQPDIVLMDIEMPIMNGI